MVASQIVIVSICQIRIRLLLSRLRHVLRSNHRHPLPPRLKTTRADRHRHPRHARLGKTPHSIGQGGMGIVYRGRDQLLNRDVAVKFLTNAIAAPDDPNLRRFWKAHARRPRFSMLRSPPSIRPASWRMFPISSCSWWTARPSHNSSSPPAHSISTKRSPY